MTKRIITVISMIILTGFGGASLKAMAEDPENIKRVLPAGVISEEEIKCRTACKSMFDHKMTELNQKKMGAMMDQSEYERQRFELEQELYKGNLECLGNYRWIR